MKIIRIFTPFFFIIQLFILLLYFIQSYGAKKKQAQKYPDNNYLFNDSYIFPGPENSKNSGKDFLFEEKTTNSIPEYDYLFYKDSIPDTLKTEKKYIEREKFENIPEQISLTELPKISKGNIYKRLY